MLSPEHCLEMAELCELRANEATEAHVAREWQLMAQEWRLAAATSQKTPAPLV